MLAGTVDLPKLFAQPFEGTFSTKYSTVSCHDFMMNITRSSAFRKCRPFSLLVPDQDAFITVSLFDFRASPLACPSPFLSLFIRTCSISSSICNSRLEPLTVYIWVGDGQGDGRALRGTSGPLLLLSSAGREAFSRY